MTILVTGFEPFGQSAVNASAVVVTSLAGARLRGVVTAVLPTSYRRAGAHVADLLRAHRPSTVVMLGLAGSAARICIEQVASNLDDCAAPDNDGEVRLRRRIIEGAPDRYPSSLQLDRMADTARKLGERVRFSRDAGGYVCNHVFFTTAHMVAAGLPGSRCGFVHLPPIPRPDDERMARFVGIVRAWIADRPE